MSSEMVTGLYCDGGVIGSNPSGIGGTYAYCLVSQDGWIRGRADILTRSDNGGPVTNNQTELMALLAGLRAVPVWWAGTVYSDSMVTLGRAFMGWKWTNIPAWMHKIYQDQRQRMNWDSIKYVLLDGHPTRAQLTAGVGKRGHLVSEHNVWCDKACTAAGIAYLDGVMARTQQRALTEVMA